MQARVITVKSRRAQAEVAAALLRGKGWNARVHEGYNYGQTLDAHWLRELMKMKDSGFFVSAHLGYHEFISACCARSHIGLWLSQNEPLLICEDDVDARHAPAPVEAVMRDEFVMYDSRWHRYQPAAQLWRMHMVGCGLNCYLVDPRKVRASLPLKGIEEHIDWHILKHNDVDRVKAWVSNIRVPSLNVPSTRQGLHMM